MSDKEAEAYRLGLKQGYGEGLKDGVDLGLEAATSGAVAALDNGVS